MNSKSKPFPDTIVKSPEWQVTEELIPYPEALETMTERVKAIQNGSRPELVWLLQHPPLYTAGTSAKAADLLHPQFPVYEAGRGGQYTYHGPGQRIAYVLLDLSRRGKDVRVYVHQLEEWLIRALARLDVTALRREGRVGLWVERPDGQDDKIAAIGVRISRWTSFHGIALNVDPDLSHYAGIVPCGISDHGITSLAQLGKTTDMGKVDEALRAAWAEVFG